MGLQKCKDHTHWNRCSRFSKIKWWPNIEEAKKKKKKNFQVCLGNREYLNLTIYNERNIKENNALGGKKRNIKENNALGEKKMRPIWVSLGRCITGFPRLSDLNSTHWFLIVLEVGSSRSGWQHGWVLGENSHFNSQMAFLLCPYVVERKREHSLSIRALMPSWGLHPHHLITSQRPHLQTPSHQGLEFWHEEF